MNKEQIFGVGRAFLVFIGGILVGHGVMTGDDWTLIAGFISTSAVAAYAAFVVHNLTSDAVLSVARAAIGAFGGYLANRGYVTASDVELTSAFIMVALPAVWSAYVHRATPDGSVGSPS